MSSTATARVIKAIAGIAVVFLALALPLALLIPGDRPFWRAYIHWALAIPGVLIFWFGLESLGTWMFDRPSVNRLSSPARIGVIVVGLILIFAVIIGVFQLIEAYAL